ncbi:MAG: MTAP family purine nucleoside phosphorylase [bacterium]|nr:MTAP family purine nucleoside phosphorylase [bacterium]
MNSPKNVVILSGTIDIESTFDILDEKWVNTRFGKVFAKQIEEHCWLINRHGKEGLIPPHAINHPANLLAAKQLGNSIVGVGSVGSLDELIYPGQLGVPSDIFCPFPIETICGPNERIHAIPQFDYKLRAILLEQLTLNGFDVVDGGVYAQSRGPRFESQAEIQWLSDYAHYVGMTAASELTIACEIQIPYALLVSVDNWGNGIGGVKLTMDEFLKGVAQNHQAVRNAIQTLLPSLIEYSAFLDSEK